MIMENGDAGKECSVIISSCDAYSDIWEAFFVLFFKYWPDCPFSIYLISETKKYPDDRVRMLHIGEDKKWAANMKIALRSIHTQYIVSFQEDYILEGKVNTQRILGLLNILRENNAAYLKLWPSPMPSKGFKNYSDIGEIKKGDKYSISLLPAIWDKKIFESLLIDGESAWDMELKGSARSVSVKEPFLSVYDEAVDCFYATAVKKGTWFYDAVKLCEREGITIDRSKRKVETRRQYLLRKLKAAPIIGRPISFALRQGKKIFS